MLITWLCASFWGSMAKYSSLLKKDGDKGDFQCFVFQQINVLFLSADY